MTFFATQVGRAEQERADHAGEPGEGQEPRRCGGCWWRSRSGTSGRPPPGRWPTSSGRSQAVGRAPPGGAGRGRGHRRRRVAETIKEWFEVDWHREIVDQVARRPGSCMEDPEPVDQAPQTLAGLTFVVTGTPGGVQPRRGVRWRSRPRGARKVTSSGVEEDGFRGGGGGRRRRNAFRRYTRRGG